MFQERGDRGEPLRQITLNAFPEYRKCLICYEPGTRFLTAHRAQRREAATGGGGTAGSWVVNKFTGGGGGGGTGVGTGGTAGSWVVNKFAGEERRPRAEAATGKSNNVGAAGGGDRDRGGEGGVGGTAAMARAPRAAFFVVAYL